MKALKLIEQGITGAAPATGGGNNSRVVQGQRSGGGFLPPISGGRGGRGERRENKPKFKAFEGKGVAIG